MQLQLGLVAWIVAIAGTRAELEPFAEPLDPCPSTKWKDLAFLGSPAERGYLYKGFQPSFFAVWRDRYLPVDGAGSLAFLGVAAFSLLLFVLWRCIRGCAILCCCRESCEQARGEKDAVHLVAKAAASWILKTLAALLALATIGLAVWGMVALDEMASPLWAAERGLRQRTEKIVDTTDALVQRVGAVSGRLMQLIDISGNDVQVEALCTPLAEQTADTYRKYLGSAAQLNRTIVGRLVKLEGKWKGPTEAYDKFRLQVSYGVFGTVLVFSLVLLVSMALNCPFGVAFMVLLLLLLACLYLAAATGIATGLAIAQDVCYHSEDTMVHGSSEQMKPLVRFYLYGPATTKLDEMLLSADIVDLNEVYDALIPALEGVLEQLPASLKAMPEAQQTLQRLAASPNATASLVDELIEYGDYAAVHDALVLVKYHACCQLPNDMAEQWYILTAGGWAVVATCWAASFLLMRLDMVPQSGTCCSCTCMTQARLQSLLDQEAAEDGKALRRQQDSGSGEVVPTPRKGRRHHGEGAPRQQRPPHRVHPEPVQEAG